MSAWRLLSRLNLFAPRLPSGRQLQLHLDTARIHVITPPPRFPFGDPNLSPPSSFESHARRVRNHLHQSAVHQLRHLSRALHAPCLHTALVDSLGFSLRIRQSGVPDAGRGIYVQGCVPRGEVVTLYPGVSYLPSQVRRLDRVNDYFISRYDGVVIDGAASVDLEVPGVGGSDEAELEHPFAVGHLVNHPPKGVAPNVLQFMLDLDVRKLRKDVIALVPTKNFEEIAGGILEGVENVVHRQRVPGVEMFVGERGTRRTLALVALRDLTEEEIFMDYRFNPRLPHLPEWYHACDEEGSERRWTASGALF